LKILSEFSLENAPPRENSKWPSCCTARGSKGVKEFPHGPYLQVGDAPVRYRHTVLEPGGSMSANDLVKSFLGRPQQMTAFQHWLNEEFRPSSDN
jgi:hypothetical protein